MGGSGLAPTPLEPFAQPPFQHHVGLRLSQKRCVGKFQLNVCSDGLNKPATEDVSFQTLRLTRSVSAHDVTVLLQCSFLVQPVMLLHLVIL